MTILAPLRVSTPQQIALDWLSTFSAALLQKDAECLASLFLETGWLRESLVFGWDCHSIEGREKISRYLEKALVKVAIENVVLDERTGLAPSYFPITNEVSGVEVAFTFETSVFNGRGFARLVPGANGIRHWKALSVYLAMDDIKGHEEASPELGTYEGHTRSWEEVDAERRTKVEEDPYVLIVGAGQTGLQVAARFRQMGIRAIVVEKHTRIGDNWRKRYPTLSLHTPSTHHNLLYAPFPKNWPIFTSRDKMATWLECYAETQDLVVWTSSFLEPGPTFDVSAHRWTAVINKGGSKVTIRPSHIVLATGTLGEPYTPSIPSMDAFGGSTMHASAYQGGRPFTGKRVLVVGAGNTSADVCQDLATRGAAAVTMLQRSATCVTSAAFIKKKFERTWPDGVPTEICDFKIAAMPLGLLRVLMIATQAQNDEFDSELHNKLKRRGLKLSSGPDCAGPMFLLYERLGGFWVEAGVADLIDKGDVRVKQGVEISRFTESSVVFTDGTELEVDSIIFATGYHNIRTSMKKIFGDEIINQTQEVWGLDEEYELKGCYRPSGHPGLWFAGGDFFHSSPNACSGIKGLLIKAEELGLKKSFKNPSSISARLDNNK